MSGRPQQSVCAVQHIRRERGGAQDADQRQSRAKLSALAPVKVVAQEERDASPEHPTGDGNSEQLGQGKCDRFHERAGGEMFRLLDRRGQRERSQ